MSLGNGAHHENATPIGMKSLHVFNVVSTYALSKHHIITDDWMVHESTNLHLPMSLDLNEVESPYLQYHCPLSQTHNQRGYDLVPSIWAVNSRGTLIEMYPPSLVSCQAIFPFFCGRLRMSVDSPLRADSGFPLTPSVKMRTWDLTLCDVKKF